MLKSILFGFCFIKLSCPLVRCDSAHGTPRVSTPLATFCQEILRVPHKDQIPQNLRILGHDGHSLCVKCETMGLIAAHFHIPTRGAALSPEWLVEQYLSINHICFDKLLEIVTLRKNLTRTID